MVDYHKFDSIIDSDDDNSEDEHREGMVHAMRPAPSSSHAQTPSLSPSPSLPAQTEARPTMPMTKKGKEGRFKFEHGGRLIYEWEQNLNEVIIYIAPPPGVTKRMLDIEIAHKHLRVGIVNTPPYIDEDTGGAVKTSESMWMLSDGELVINLQKMHKAEAWDSALVGQLSQTVDPHTKEEIKKKLMLERFQEEHPSFDFSGAEFNGQVPDAREFMGGVKYS